jgi:hypothetical protein
MNQRGNGASDLLGRVRENPDLLILDPTKTIRSFTVALNSSMGLKSGRGQGTLIDGLLAAIDTLLWRSFAKPQGLGGEADPYAGTDRRV